MINRKYFRPLVQVDVAAPKDALSLAGGWGWFTHVEVLSRDIGPTIVAAAAIPATELAKLTTPRPPLAAMMMDRPQIMGILNATPDSFSDGGKHAAAEDAIKAGIAMVAAGVDLLDVGGESTRPGAAFIEPDVEIQRTAPIIAGLRTAGIPVPISIDTRKAAVARAGLKAGASLVNDVSGFTFDAALAPLCAEQKAPVCVMHALGDPATMQQGPRYDNVLLDVFDFLEAQIDTLIATGISRDRIIADPGIGFGKTLDHNLTLLARLSVFHSLGVPILLGASRKRFIGTISGTEQASERMAGSIGVALAALNHGIQILRVHDVPETIQAIALWRASMTGRPQ